jgi:anti-sigma B factor antagonist
MNIIVEKTDSATIIRITGSVDGLTADTLLTALQSEIDGGNVHLVADLTAVEYTSSAGLRALLATVKSARQRGGDFRLAGAQAPVHRVLEMSGFTSILKVYGGVDAAVASYSA